jgi:hypothetical protein
MSTFDTPLTPEQIQKDEVNSQHHNYFVRVAKDFDIFVNGLANGNVGETISARCGRLQDTNEFARLLAKGLNELEPQHCEKAEAGTLADGQHLQQVETQTLDAQEKTP